MDFLYFQVLSLRCSPGFYVHYPVKYTPTVFADEDALFQQGTPKQQRRMLAGNKSPATAMAAGGGNSTITALGRLPSLASNNTPFKFNYHHNLVREAEGT